MSSAVDLLKKAIEYDCNGRRMEALKLYQDGIARLLEEYKGLCVCNLQTNYGD